MSDDDRPAEPDGSSRDPQDTAALLGSLEHRRTTPGASTPIEDLVREQQAVGVIEEDLVVDEELPPPPTRRRKMNPLLEWLIVVAVAISSALLVRAYVVQQFAVEGESMLSTLHDGDRVLVNRLSYRLHDPRRGDVVVLRKFDSATEERDLIKRVIGLPGETIEVRSCVVYIDGVVLDEPYLDTEIQARDGCGGDQPPVPVPDGEVFVLGDHRGRSSDSRLFGAVDYDLLIGRAFVIIWPVSDWAWL